MNHESPWEGELYTAVCDRCRKSSVLLLVPCHDEEQTVRKVVEGFRSVIPWIEVLVGDNASTDRTAEEAIASGAEVLAVPIKGKGRVVRRLLEHSDHDVTIMVDGDATYDPEVAASIVHQIHCLGYDLVNVSRVVDDNAGEQFRRGHQFGNRMLTALQRRLTGIQIEDILSGYKGLSRRFVASLPVRSQRFQIEVEIAANAVALDLAYVEIHGFYNSRPAGSPSKLSTYGDGWAILRAIFKLYRDLRPFPAFSMLAAPWLAISVVAVGLPIKDYLETGLVLRFPSLIAGVAAFVTGMLLLTTGWILDRVQALRRDQLALAGADHIRLRYRREDDVHRRPTNDE